MSEIEDVKSHLNIADIVGGYVKLAPAGSNLKGLCPFHNEKTPSFMVNEDRQIFHCFGCGKGGDVISFVQEIEGIGFREALQMLAERAGVKLERRQGAPRDDGKKRIKELMAEAVRVYRENLRNPAGAKAFEYLKERGVTDESIERFSLGFAKNSWSDLLDELHQVGFTSAEAERAGLAVQSQKDSSRTYDRFRGRIMFPIYSPHGEPIGFSGRVLPGDTGEMGKYINTPQSELYDKSQAMYGISLAKVAIKKKDLCILLEGNLDVVMSHQAGVENAVATCGTAVTAAQLRIVKRYTKNIAFAFDADQAGIDAAYKGINIALASGLNVNAINIGEAGEGFKDVADIVGSAPTVWRSLAERTRPIMEYFFETTLARYDISQVHEKRKATEELLDKIALLGNKIDQAHYVEKLSDEVRINTGVLYDILNEKQRDPGRYREAAGAKRETRTESDNFSLTISEKAVKLANRIIALTMLYPELIGRLKEPETVKILQGELDAESQKVIKIIAESGAQFTNPDNYLELIDDERLRTRVSRLVTIAENQFASYNGDHSGKGFSPMQEFDSCVKELKEIAKKKLLDSLLVELKQAEKEGDRERVDGLMKKYSAAIRKK